MRSKILNLWGRLTGNPAECSPESRAFNSICVFTLLLLLSLLPFNIFIGLHPITLLILILTVVVLIIYYQSRVKNRLLISVTVYAIMSYIALIVNFYYNSGISGPGILLFFFTFIMLIAFTPRPQHKIWVFVHSVIAIVLIIIQYKVPDLIKFTYSSRHAQYFDISTSYIITLGVIYVITKHLRNNYTREKELAEARADEIEKQHHELERINEQKNKLFSIIAHDLRSPLNSIQSFLELLNEMELEPHEKDEIQKLLLDQTRNTSEMLFNLLAWSKTQMEGVSLSLTRLPLLGTLKKTLDVQKIIAAKKGIELNYQINEKIKVVGDADMLQLIVRNIVNNAIKFSPSDTKIEITVIEQAGNCLISVKDSGKGIPIEKQNNIFSFKAESTYGTNNEKGVGLGLVLCKEFVELQKGTIWFQSNEKEGTTFYISLPNAN